MLEDKIQNKLKVKVVSKPVHTWPQCKLASDQAPRNPFPLFVLNQIFPFV